MTTLRLPKGIGKERQTGVNGASRAAGQHHIVRLGHTWEEKSRWGQITKARKIANARLAESRSNEGGLEIGPDELKGLLVKTRGNRKQDAQTPRGEC